MIRNARAWMAKVGPLNYCCRMATRQFAKRVLRRDLVLQLPNGRRVYLPRLSEFSSVAWVTRGAVDDGFEQLLRRFARPGSAFFDVGAHFGFYAVFLSDLHSPIVAFEPDARILPSLRFNLSGIPGAVCMPTAISDREGVIRFLSASSAPQSRILRPDEATEEQAVAQVQVTTIDAAWRGLNQPDVGSVKIDTEGHETAVIEGAKDMIDRCRPQLLIEATAESLSPHAGWLASLEYRAVLLSERHHGRAQVATVVAPEAIGTVFQAGMILLLPQTARCGPAWDRLAHGISALQ